MGILPKSIGHSHNAFRRQFCCNRVLPQVVARTTPSPLFLENDLPYLVGRVLGQYPEQSNGGTTHVLAARGQERAQLGQDVLSNHLGLDVCWCGKTTEVREVQSTAGRHSGSDSNSNQIKGDLPSPWDGAMPNVRL